MRSGTRKVADSKPDITSPQSQQDGEDAFAMQDLGKIQNFLPIKSFSKFLIISFL
jgi:hypothetical protein